ncbi:queuosine precursor transporter [Methanoculleus sp. Wushi-C6]|uniref:Probable queuosine precursor transporter n=1 Tax=Methanoculleus caldifontis TaxID=2651577 RepID=A0ABU3X527_9EURY|nr:queuosine precursor transporter [Methanoculleus sp. Wushi-C6]MDV2482541.1 queuosine precursor transporter [Methanoculleus sp. Wushi-C6]
MPIPSVWIYRAVSLTIATYAGAVVVRRYPEYGFAALTGLYIICPGASRIIAARLIEFDIGIATFIAPASVFVYPFVAQAVDMINEVYGRAMTRVAIAIALLSQILLAVLIAMTNSLTPAPGFAFEAAWQSIFTQGLWIIFASWVAFLVTQNIDCYVFDRLKRAYPDRIVLRSAFSDVADLTLDSIIFVSIAFFAAGIPLLPLIIGQIVSKGIVGVLDTPWFVWYKRYLSAGEPEKAASGPLPPETGVI